MQILPIVYHQNYIQQNNSGVNPFSNNSKDIFVKTKVTKFPSFGNNRTKEAQVILKNSGLFDKYAKFIEKVASAAFFTLVATAAGDELLSDNQETVDNNENNLFSQMMENFLQNNKIAINEEPVKAENNDTEIVSKAEIDDQALGKCELTAKAEIDDQTSSKYEFDERVPQPTEEILENPEENSPVQEDLQGFGVCKINFPKKHGRLTANQEKLKSVVSSLSLSDSDCEKLTALCEKALEKNPSALDGKMYTGNALAFELSDALLSAENKSEIIDKYYNEFISNKAERSQNTEIYPEADTTLKNLRENPLTPPTVLDKIELPPETKKRTKIQRGTPNEIREQLGAAHVEIINEENKNNNFDDKKVVSVINEEQGIYTYGVPKGCVKEDVYDAIKEMLIKTQLEVFEEKRNSEIVLWVNRSKTASNVKAGDIIKELETQKESTWPYKHINHGNAKLVADLINSDKRFGQYYTLHAAMRFIDRFVDLDNESIDIHEHCSEVLDSFAEVVKRAFKKKVNIYSETESNTRGSGNKYKFKVEIPVSAYNEKDKEVFGTYPMVFVVCEYHKYGESYDKNPSAKQPLILTLYPDGI